MFEKSVPQSQSTPKVILFIPFTVSENNYSLYMRALDWRYNLRSAEKKKIPDIIVYRHPDENEQDYDGYDVQFKFTQENLTSDTVIYVLADGTGDPDYVINVNQVYYEFFAQEPYQLTTNAVAWRLKQCGLTPELTRNLKAINLYICDENNNNNQLATYFGQELGDGYKEVTVNYYAALVYIPQPMLNEQGSLDIRKRACLNSYDNDGGVKLVKAGYAHDHKHSIKVSDALIQKNRSNCSPDMSTFKATPLPTFKELVAAYTSSMVTIEEADSCSISIEEGLSVVSITFPEDELDVSESGIAQNSDASSLTTIAEDLDEDTTTSSSQQKHSTVTITFLDDESDVIELDFARLKLEEPQIESPEPCRELVIWQDRATFSFFKGIKTADKKDKTNLSCGLTPR
ncbi:hypothetical protein Lste_1387 [Legionella steelei]|uniref:Uncharacterized protein n=2 Tax=Legionella steelei TaxID=947033 RepID=A0A0W0ZGE7_9GAMM|nr:hypothetical protein Lste_1387 [Legionella steelei]